MRKANKALAADFVAEPDHLWRLRLLQQHFPQQLGPSETAAAREVVDVIEGLLTGALVSPFLDR